MSITFVISVLGRPTSNTCLVFVNHSRRKDARRVLDMVSEGNSFLTRTNNAGSNHHWNRYIFGTNSNDENKNRTCIVQIRIENELELYPTGPDKPQCRFVRIFVADAVV